MYLPDFELHEPAALEEAAAMLGHFGSQARLFAGGTALLVDLKSGRTTARHVISLGRVHGLHGILPMGGAPRSDGQETKGLRIGALTTVSELASAADLVGPYAVIREAACAMANPQIRNLATIGGNIVAAVPCADLPPVLMVLEASIVIWSPRGERTVQIREFFLGPRRTVLAADEILIAVLVPPAPAKFGTSYQRFSLRDGNAIAVVGVAASLTVDQRGLMQKALVALNAVAPTIRLVPKASEALVGRRADDDTALTAAAEAAMTAAVPISDVRASAEYRRELVGILTRRAIRDAWRLTSGE